MPSFEEKFYRVEGGALVRLKRDLALVRESLAFVWLWATRGRQLRREVARARRAGRQVRIDHLGGGGGQ